MNIKNETKLIHPISYGLSRVKLPLIPISIGDYTTCLDTVPQKARPLKKGRAMTYITRKVHRASQAARRAAKSSFSKEGLGGLS